MTSVNDEKPSFTTRNGVRRPRIGRFDDIGVGEAPVERRERPLTRDNGPNQAAPRT